MSSLQANPDIIIASILDFLHIFSHLFQLSLCFLDCIENLQGAFFEFRDRANLDRHELIRIRVKHHSLTPLLRVHRALANILGNQLLQLLQMVFRYSFVNLVVHAGSELVLVRLRIQNLTITLDQVSNLLIASHFFSLWLKESKLTLSLHLLHALWTIHHQSARILLLLLKRVLEKSLRLPLSLLLLTKETSTLSCLLTSKHTSRLLLLSSEKTSTSTRLCLLSKALSRLSKQSSPSLRLSCRCQANIDIHLRLCALTEHTTS